MRFVRGLSPLRSFLLTYCLTLDLSLIHVKASWSEVTESVEVHGHGGNHLRGKYPLVNKCCPSNYQYSHGDCVDGAQDAPGKSRRSLDLDPGKSEEGHWDLQTTTLSSSLFEQDETLADAPVEGPVFRLKFGKPSCSGERIEWVIQRKEMGLNLNLSRGSRNEMTESSPELSVLLTADGSLIWKDDQGFLNTHHYPDFCIDRMNETAYVAIMCKPLCTADDPCVRKCCKPEDILDLDQQKCVEAQNRWSPFLYNSSFEPIDIHETRRVHYKFGLPQCAETYFIALSQDTTEKFYALVDGSLTSMTIGGKTVTYPQHIFCIDGAGSRGSSHSHSLREGDSEEFTTTSEFLVQYSGSELDQIAIICYPEIEVEESQLMSWRYQVLAIIEFISAFFFLLIAIVYLLLWEHQNIHGWLQFAYVIAGLFAFASLATLQAFTDKIHSVSTNFCEVMGSVIHFNFLSVFFWLTSLNFDLWWTFSGCHPLRARSRNGDTRRFMFFAVFAWGGPALIAGTGFVLDFVYKDEPESTVLRPRFGDRNCYFRNDMEQLPYFFGPVGLLLLANMIFFLHTVYSLQKLQSDTEFATKQSSRQEKKKFILFVKLFVVMGVIWIFEVISWTLNVFDSGNKVFWIRFFLIFDFLNAFQGFLIFVIFTCKRNTCRQLEKRFRHFASVLEGQREKGFGPNSSPWRHCLFCAIAIFLPFLHLFRRAFMICGRNSRSREIRRNVSHTTMTSAYDRSRNSKISECSNSTTFSCVDAPLPGSFEMNVKSTNSLPM